MKLDRLDIAILEQLQANARISNVDLAREVNLTASPCLNRVRALEDSGLITRHVTLLDTERLGLRLNVFIQVSLEKQREDSLGSFERAIALRPEVMECYLMTGEHDYLLRVVVADLADFERIHSQHLTRLPRVASVQSSFAMRTVTRATVLPLR